MEQEIVKHPEPGNVWINCEVRTATDKAIKVIEEKTLIETWVPKSQIGADNVDGVYRRGVKIEIMIPDWLAEKKGFI